MITFNKLRNAKDLEKAFELWNVAIYRYVYSRLRSQGIAEDITQEVFIKAWRSRDTFHKHKSSLKNWLYAIATNTIRDYLRSQMNRPEVSPLEEDLPSTEDKIEKSIQQKEVTNFVFEKLKLLSNREQELLLLRYREDISIKEIAKVLDLKYSATKVAIHRATEKLRKLCNPIY